MNSTVKHEEIQSELFQSSSRTSVNGHSYPNFEDDCRAHMATNECHFNGILKTDGKRHRYSRDSKKNEPDEFYIAYAGNFPDTGKPYLRCFYGTWSGGFNKYTYRSYENDNAISREEWKKIKAEEKRQNEAIEKDLKKEKEDRIQLANMIWNEASETPTTSEHTEYLIKKKSLANGVRYGTGRECINGVWHDYPAIIISLRNNNEEIQAVQLIKADGSKKIIGPKTGNFHIIGKINNQSKIYIAEGYCTADSIYQATDQPVIMAVDCGNLDKVTQNIHELYPSNPIIICGDDDVDTECNPGRNSAENAARKHNCRVVFPKFPEDFRLPNSISEKHPKGKRPTDFNDLHVHFDLMFIGTQITPETEEVQEKEIPRIFKPYSFEDLLNLPPKKWIVDQIMGCGDIGMMYGPPGSGKTFIVIDLIMSACLGKTFANSFSIQKPLSIAYCAGEGLSGLPSRFSAAAKYYDIVSLKNFTFYNTVPQLYSGDYQHQPENNTLETIRQFIAEWKIRKNLGGVDVLDVLFIDTLHTATTAADENSARDMGKVLSLCRLAAKELRCAVVLVHHTNKNATAERGSSALRGAMDFMIEIAKTDTSSCMKCSKLKDGKGWTPKSFEFCQIDGCESVCVTWKESIASEIERLTGKDKDKHRIIDEMKLYSENRFTANKLAERVNLTAEYTRKLLNELVDSKKCETGLYDPKKKVSKVNPIQFWINP